MTVQNTIVKNKYQGNGSTTVFPYTFALNEEDVEYVAVYITDADGVTTATENFTVDTDSRTVTYPANDDDPLPAGHIIVLRRCLPNKQELNLENQGAFFAEDIEAQLDRQVMLIQQLDESMDRCVKVPMASVQTADELLETIFDKSASAVASASAAATSAASSAAIATKYGNLDEAVTTVTAKATAASASATAAATSATTASMKATAAGASAAAAAASVTAASTKATEAAASAAAAGNSAGLASSSLDTIVGIYNEAVASGDVVNPTAEMKNLLNPNTTTNGYIVNSGGIITPWIHGETSDFIPIKQGQSITISPYCYKFLAYNTSKVAISSSYESPQNQYTYTAEQDGYIRASVYRFDINNVAQIEYGVNATDYSPYGYRLNDTAFLGNRSKTTHTVNLVDPAQMVSGVLNSGNGTVIDTIAYTTTAFIHLAANQSITASPYIRFFAVYGTGRNFISCVDTETYRSYTYTASNECYVRMSFYTDGSKYQAEYGTEATAYVPYGYSVMDENVLLNQAQKENVREYSGNILYKKKWAACGDSFTKAGYNTSDGFNKSVYTYMNGKYKNEQIVYPFIIGLRNDMDVVNLAQHGMTMCDIDGTRENSFTHGDIPVYKQIPADVDYITIKLGINDEGFGSPIGNIDDNTTATFYGAYNVALDYITEHYPNAHIGIIVTNGCSSSAFTDATIAIAEKWGIPYIDEVNDKKVPLLHRANRPGVSALIKDRKLDAFSVSRSGTGNTHPNVAAHNFESTFIEEWLRRL